MDRTRLQTAGRGATPFTDCFNAEASGRRTHFFAPGVAEWLTPDHFDFSGVSARVLHLGLPGAHRRLDEPWEGDTTGWASVLRKARAAGLKTNLEMVSTTREKVAAFGRSCLPFLDLLIVNDYEIGCVADVETRREGRADPLRVAEALSKTLRLGPIELAVAHFPEGAIAADAGGRRFAGVRRAARVRDRGRQWRGRRLRRGRALRLARGLLPDRRPCARPRRRRRLDARSLDHEGRPHRGRRSVPRPPLRPPTEPAMILNHRLWFIRHGETDFNREGRLQGQQDTPLNPKGREQAGAVGRALRKLAGPEMAALDAAGGFVASPLERTRSTMELARAAMGFAPTAYRLDERLKELTFGDWEGFTWSEIEARDPAAVAARMADKWDFTPPNGESYAGLARRMAPWVETVDSDLCVVAHGGVARGVDGPARRRRACQGGGGADPAGAGDRVRGRAVRVGGVRRRELGPTAA